MTSLWVCVVVVTVVVDDDDVVVVVVFCYDISRLLHLV